MGWADCRAVATTAAEAIEAVKVKMRDRLASGQIARVELHPDPADNPAPSSYQHPWMQFAERLKNNPLLEEIDQFISLYFAHSPKDDRP